MGRSARAGNAGSPERHPRPCPAGGTSRRAQGASAPGSSKPASAPSRPPQSRNHPAGQPCSPARIRLLGAEPLAEEHHLVDLLARHVAVDNRHDHVGEGADIDLGRSEGGPPLAITRSQESARPIPPASTCSLTGSIARRLAEPWHQPEELEEEVGGEMLLDERQDRHQSRQGLPPRKGLVPGAGGDHRLHLLASRADFIASTSSTSIWPDNMLRFSGLLERHRRDLAGDLQLTNS